MEESHGEQDERFAELEEGMEDVRIPGFKVRRRIGEKKSSDDINGLIAEFGELTAPEDVRPDWLPPVEGSDDA